MPAAEFETHAHDGTRLVGYEWHARTKPAAATVAILHGYAEHVSRFAHVAEALNAKGINVIGIDLRGHGGSDGRRGFVKTYTDFHQDVDALLAHARTISGGSPLFVLAHSNGGLIWLHYSASGRGAGFGVQGAVVSSPFLGFNPQPATPVVALMRCLSSCVPAAPIPNGIKGKNLMRDPDMIAAHAQDKLLFDGATPRWIVEAYDAQAEVHARAQEGNFPTPMLLMYAGTDRIVDCAATDRLAEAMSSVASSAQPSLDLEIVRLDDHFHELLNEPPADRAKLIEHIAQWVLARAEKSART